MSGPMSAAIPELDDCGEGVDIGAAEPTEDGVPGITLPCPSCVGV